MPTENEELPASGSPCGRRSIDGAKGCGVPEADGAVIGSGSQAAAVGGPPEPVEQQGAPLQMREPKYAQLKVNIRGIHTIST